LTQISCTTQYLHDAASSSSREHCSVDPFAASRRGLDGGCPVRPALRAAGPVVVAEAPAGGPVWIVTDGDAARPVFTDPRVGKDPVLAPAHWDPRAAGLEQTAGSRPR
jgi:hypothetical protein